MKLVKEKLSNEILKLQAKRDFKTTRKEKKEFKINLKKICDLTFDNADILENNKSIRYYEIMSSITALENVYMYGNVEQTIENIIMVNSYLKNINKNVSDPQELEIYETRLRGLKEKMKTYLYSLQLEEEKRKAL